MSLLQEKMHQSPLELELNQLASQILAIQPDFSKAQIHNTANKINSICTTLPYFVVIVDFKSAIPIFFCQKALAFFKHPDLKQTKNNPKKYEQIFHPRHSYLIMEGKDHFRKNPNIIHSFSLRVKKAQKKWVWVHGVCKLMKIGAAHHTLNILQEEDVLMNNLLPANNQEFTGKEKELVKLLSLTKREREVLTYIVQELSNDTIAEILSLSVHTVRTHRKHIHVKLKTKSIVGLVKYGLLLEQLPISYFNK